MILKYFVTLTVIRPSWVIITFQHRSDVTNQAEIHTVHLMKQFQTESRAMPSSFFMQSMQNTLLGQAGPCCLAQQGLTGDA